MFKLNAKFGADLLLYSLSHFECDSHTVHMLTQWCPLPPLTSTVKSSLFTHVHSSPLSLGAGLHRCHPNHSRYVNNGWSFSRQTSLYIIEVGNTTLRSKFKCRHCSLLVTCLWAHHSISLCLSFLFWETGAVIVGKTQINICKAHRATSCSQSALRNHLLNE
ncbi:hypothetical protein HJG60_009575 [Phyllostomus discolor]|uniref:Uncharacterized protein n=1 Tax=Phyllostomus discolor TaxID=89673 RepID=A0A834DAZ2_9CHIR|nr:hypothetical protein HJG60_009575 [Phyllostomus discolor]